MTKTEDPYKALVDLTHDMAGAAALQPTAGIGVIVSPPPDIQIRYHGFVLRAKDLYIDEYWIPGHRRHIVGETDFRGGGSGDPAYESHNHPIDNDETWTDTWNPGDKVLLIPVTGDDNRTTKQFIVGMKLKRLDGN
ncbi:MAG: DUF2577 family protein [Selenomonas noxia]